MGLGAPGEIWGKETRGGTRRLERGDDEYERIRKELGYERNEPLTVYRHDDLQRGFWAKIEGGREGRRVVLTDDRQV